MKLYRCLVLILFTLLISNTIFASEPSVDSHDVIIEYAKAPTRTMKVTFDTAVTLHSMAIKHNNGYLLNLDTQVTKEPAAVFYFNLPKLPPAEYLVRWKTQVDDGPIFSGEATFTLHDDTYPRPSTKKPDYGILHRKLHH